MTTYSDEHLEHFGEEFRRRGLAARGLRFADFMAARVPDRGDPAEAAAARIEEEEFAPLLPAQRAVAAGVDSPAVAVARTRVKTGIASKADAELIERELGRLRSGVYLCAQRNGRFFERLHHHLCRARHLLARNDS